MHTGIMRASFRVAGVKVHAARGLSLHDGVHLAREHRDESKGRGERERVARGDVEDLHAGIGQVRESRHAEHEHERQGDADQAQACAQPADHAIDGRECDDMLARGSERDLYGTNRRAVVNVNA